MRAFSRPIITVLLTVIIIVAGFFFLLRGCLSKYDERSALPQVLYFEKDGQRLIFSLVKFEKATSYSRKGNMVSKSVSTQYFIQSNDAVSGKKIAAKKIKHHRDIRNFPVKIMGASQQNAWLFLGEIMAFDPFTLTTVADIEILEQKNPAVKGKFPAEERYYQFNREDQNIYFTALDGSPWKINTQSLLVTPDDEESENPQQSKVKVIEKLLKQNQADQDSLLEQKLRRPSRLLQEKQITMAAYKKLTEEFHEERVSLYKVRDSLQRILTGQEKNKRNGDDIQRKIQSLAESSGTHFSQVKTNQDTLRGKWYGLYSKEEFEKLYKWVQNQAVYNEKARRQFYASTYSPDRNDDFLVDKENAVARPGPYYLDGGFLLNKQTGFPISIDNNSFLIVYKNQIGNEGTIQVSKTGTDGRQLWTFNSALKEWGNYLFTGKLLIITGTNNKELSSNDCNLLTILDLVKGTAVTYDFFDDK